MGNLLRTIPPKPVAISGTLMLALSLIAVLVTGPPTESLAQSSVWLEKDARIPVDLSGSFYTVDGKETTLSEYSDDVLFLNFWATWCGPCRAEMPSIAALQDKLGREGLRVLAVTDEDFSTVEGFLKSNRYPFTVLVDQDAKLSARLRIWAVPWTLILDKKRNLVHFHSGARRWDTPDVVENLEQILSE
jgi:thiol-disulfide isomerase/thioredoxin